MAPKDGLEQPTTGEEEPVEEGEEPFDEELFAEADELVELLSHFLIPTNLPPVAASCRLSPIF